MNNNPESFDPTRYDGSHGGDGVFRRPVGSGRS